MIITYVCLSLGLRHTREYYIAMAGEGLHELINVVFFYRRNFFFAVLPKGPPQLVGCNQMVDFIILN